MKHCKRPGGDLATNRWLHDRGLNVGNLSGATDAMFVPSSSNPASFAIHQRSPARPSSRSWKPLGGSTSVTLAGRDSTSASLDRTEQTTNYRERASVTNGGSDGRAGSQDGEHEVGCTDSALPSPLDLVPRSLRTSETSRKRKAGGIDLAVESSSLSKLRKTGDSVRQVRLETKRNELGIFFPEAAERRRQRSDARSNIGTSSRTAIATGPSSSSLPDQTRSLGGWQNADIAWHSFDTSATPGQDDMFAEALSPSSSQQRILKVDALVGTRATPPLRMSPEKTPDVVALPQPGWKYLLGPHGGHCLQPLQPPVIPQPVQTGRSDQLDPSTAPSDPALPTFSPSTSAGHPTEHPSNDDLEDGQIEEDNLPATPVPPSQQPVPKKKNEKEQNQQLPLRTDDSNSLTRKQKKARARQAKRDRQAACRRALDRIDAFEPTAADEERLNSLMATTPLWVEDLEWTQALLKRFAKICGGKA